MAKSATQFDEGRDEARAKSTAVGVVRSFCALIDSSSPEEDDMSDTSSTEVLVLASSFVDVANCSQAAARRSKGKQLLAEGTGKTGPAAGACSFGTTGNLSEDET